MQGFIGALTVGAFIYFMRPQLISNIDPTQEPFSGQRLYGPWESVDRAPHYSHVATHRLGGGGSCMNCQSGGANQMCHEIAKANCQIPTWRKTDCWTQKYQECADNCRRSGKGLCDCDAFASARCRSSNDPAEACYAGVVQKCMSGMLSNIPDPDRG